MTRWGSHNVAEILGLSRSADAPTGGRGWWPRPRTLGRILGLLLVAVILGGWLLTFITSLR